MLRLNKTPSVEQPPTIRLRDLLLLRRGGWSLAFLLGAATLLAVIGLLAISGWFITAAAVAGTMTATAFGFDYFRPAALIRLCAIVRTAGRYGERLASHDAALGLLKDLRCRLFMALGKKPLLQAASSPSHHGTANAMHRLVTDIDQLDQVVLRALLPWGWAGLMVVVVMAGLYWLSGTLMWAALPGVLLAWLGLPLLALWRGIDQARQSAELAERRRVALIEPLAAITSLVLWGRWPEMAQRVKKWDADYLAHQERQQLLASLTTALQQVALGAAIVSVLWQAEALLAASHLTVPMLLAAVLAILALGEILAPLTHSFLALGASLAARNRLNALSEGAPRAQAAIEEVEITPPSWQLNVSQLTARLPGALVGPQRINLALKSGEILCLRGPSGCGKSTLLQVLAGELLPLSGECCLNGYPIEQWSMHNAVGYLPQQWDLFDMSLAENLRLGARHAGDSELWSVLDDLVLGTWARGLPQGLETPLGEYGAAVSGGQARRIALGRVLLARRPILLLDEPLAGLDAVTRRHVVTSLVRRAQHGILVISSHVPLELPESQVRTLYMQEDGRPRRFPPVPACLEAL
ncbi:thiol reductant ABC exporter subunit CydC [Vreelandella titanicae]|jgi:ATP-binding cassette subfamily C protein CydC|uniref:ABC transporter, CydDC cysteine exporter (CydDC-E) family, p n=1 Tax=Vreelandella titanicae BH1 TaxID=1204738 RepID=L9U5U8_9GAMM|nr:thiol reductant ABC exporter subunit CydC [Halomonas titanicae]ELY20182.1 ABC transporter, CydDC cysteine exporter (CydDC-E) family, p [Halomonas titanicae BH1]NVE93124.1 thiol reductant ABC exporter subunit CydC [Halomonas titanicae]